MHKSQEFLIALILPIFFILTTFLIAPGGIMGLVFSFPLWQSGLAFLFISAFAALVIILTIKA